MLQSSLDPAPMRPLVLACFGRGGSGIVFSALGSAPTTRTMRREWHQAVFADANRMRRGLRYLSRRGLGHRLGVGTGPLARRLQGVHRDRVMGDIRRPALAETAADWLVIKLMDHNIVRLPLIESTFGAGQIVCLTRAPLPQCESLMRSGLTCAQAVRWYNDIARSMARIRTQSILLRFEDLIDNPLETLDTLSNKLGLPPTDVFYLKDKSFGAKRTHTTDVDHAEIRAVRRSELRYFIRPDVNRAAVNRLSPIQTREILDGTAHAAACLGYGNDT